MPPIVHLILIVNRFIVEMVGEMSVQAWNIRRVQYLNIFLSNLCTIKKTWYNYLLHGAESFLRS